MGGGLMQLVAYGAQDIYLTGNPQITFFKVIYRRHTNFSMECIQQTVEGIPADKGSSTVTISRNGDLVGRIYVTLENKTSTTLITDGMKLVSQVDLEIGGQLIDRQDDEWMQIWAELTVPGGKRAGFKHMTSSDGTSIDSLVGNVQVPLQFWFCRNPGLALPLIALQYHEVKLKFTWGAYTDYAPSASASLVANSQVWADYIYLDTDERRRFAQVSHEYLIEQIQKESPTVSTDMKLNFNHPVKELIWTDSQSSSYGTSRLTLNGHDRFSDQQEEYFQLRQPYDYHTCIPNQNILSHRNTIHTYSTTATGRDPNDANTYSIEVSFTIPANTLIRGVDVRAIQAVTISNKDSVNPVTIDIGFKVGNTSDTGKDNIIPLDSDSIVSSITVPADGTATIADGTGTSTDSSFKDQHNGNSVLVFASGASNHRFTQETQVTATIQIKDASGDAYFNNVVDGVGSQLFEVKLHLQDDPISLLHDGECSKLRKKINVYSFALKPEEHQPSGTCNFSRIDSARLMCAIAPTGTVNVYAVNYNVLRIMSGMGGLAYSN